jgi:hypothetical protein
MITLPPSSANGFYSCWKLSPRVASPATSDSLSPPTSPPRSPSLMFAGSTNNFYSSWRHYKETASPNGSGSLSSSMSRPSSPLHTISEVLGQRTSWPFSLPLSERQNSESDSRPSSLATSISYAYTVKSINSRKSRLTVLYPRPVRPQRTSVEVIAESPVTSLESLVTLSSRPVSMSIPPQGNSNPVADREVSCWVVKQIFTSWSRTDFYGSISPTLW